MSLPQAIKTMLSGISGMSDDNCVYGTRNQSMTYPCVVFTIENQETLTIGTSPLRKCEVKIKSVNNTAQTTMDLSALVEGKLIAGTYNSIDFHACVNRNSVLEEPTNGNGEESNPFVCVTTVDIYYTQ